MLRTVISLKTEIKPTDLYDFLGAPEYTRDKYQGNDYAGVVTGLAWTAVGGEILFVETSLSRGKGGRLTLTGNLGDVMKESAMLALEYIKAHASVLSLNEEIFDNWNIHIHVPEGAIPKDGPSAGITMATSLASALTQMKSESQHCHDGRNHSSRQSASCGWHQGEDIGSQTCRNQGNHHECREPKRT